TSWSTVRTGTGDSADVSRAMPLSHHAGPTVAPKSHMPTAPSQWGPRDSRDPRCGPTGTVPMITKEKHPMCELFFRDHETRVRHGGARSWESAYRVAQLRAQPCSQWGPCDS